MRTTPPVRLQRLLLAGYAGYFLLGAWLLLRPVPDAPQAGVSHVLAWLQAAGFDSLNGVRVEFICNVGLFVPLTFALPWLFPDAPRHLWARARRGAGGFGARAHAHPRAVDGARAPGLRATGPRASREAFVLWSLAAFVFSVAVELIQTVFLPGRSGDWVDIVANTSGGIIGSGLAWLVLTDQHRTPRAPGLTLTPRIVTALATLALVVVACLTTAPARALIGSWATWLSAHQLDGWAGLLTDIGTWRMAFGVALLAVTALVGSLLRPTWTAMTWAGFGAGSGLVLAVLAGQFPAHLSASAALVAASTTGAFVGAWVTRGCQISATTHSTTPPSCSTPPTLRNTP